MAASSLCSGSWGTRPCAEAEATLAEHAGAVAPSTEGPAKNVWAEWAPSGQLACSLGRTRGGKLRPDQGQRGQDAARLGHVRTFEHEHGAGPVRTEVERPDDALLVQVPGAARLG